MKRKLIAVVENHFDQLWRRCFDNDFTFNGENYVSYSKIEQYYIEENIKLAQAFEDYKFQIESVCAVETYVNKFPEQKQTIKTLYAENKLKTPNTGYLILDSNMVSAESIIRNYLLGNKFFEEYVGESPKEFCRSDAFGQSAQLPQIFKNFGALHVREIFYVPFDDDVWVGLDGSAVCVKEHAFLGTGGGWRKNPPCKVCGGFGKKEGAVCPSCGGRGIDEAYARKNWTNIFLSDNKTQSGTIPIGGEEYLPRVETLAQIEQIRKEQGEDISLGFEEQMLDVYKEEIAKVESGNFEGLKVRQSPEFYPCNTGCLTSRIKTKQGLCEIENKLLACETLQAMEYIKGGVAETYDDAWKKFMLCAFHDSVTGTMVDSAYAELMQWHADLRAFSEQKYIAKADENGAWVYNPSSFEREGVYESKDGKVAFLPKMQPYAFARVTFEKEGERIGERPKIKQLPKEAVFTGKEEENSAKTDGERFFIENEYLIVEADDRGLRAVTDKRYGALSVMTPTERPCELLLESDYGSPWATLEPPYRSYPLKNHTQFVAVEKGERYTKIIYRTHMNMHMCDCCDGSQVEWSVTLFDAYDKLRIDAKVNWHSINKRLRMRFPLPLCGGEDVYGIPGGFLQREPYEPIYSWSGSNGDWAAYQWAGVQTKEKSVALFNRGTPSYRILPTEEGKSLSVSLLRSPAIATYLHEPNTYSMTAWDGMRDDGKHEFSLELAGYNAPFALAETIKDAERFARPCLPVKAPVEGGKLPYIVNGSAVVSHCKVAENKEGVIVRITECSGKAGEVELALPEGAKAVYKTDMPEKKRETLAFANTLKLSLRAFEIVTLRVVF